MLGTMVMNRPETGDDDTAPLGGAQQEPPNALQILGKGKGTAWQNPNARKPERRTTLVLAPASLLQQVSRLTCVAFTSPNNYDSGMKK